MRAQPQKQPQRGSGEAAPAPAASGGAHAAEGAKKSQPAQHQ
eukprot:gene9419-688_t